MADGWGALLGSVVEAGANAEENKRNKEFAVRMGSTQYQRAVMDMKAAGLNPMLAYMKGGNDTPGAASHPVGGNFSSAVSTAANAALARSQAEKVEAETEAAKEQPALIRAETRAKEAEADHYNAQTQVSGAEVGRVNSAKTNLDTQTERIKYEIPKIIEEAKHVEEQTGNEKIRQTVQIAERDLLEAKLQYEKGQITSQHLEQAYMRLHNILTDARVPGARAEKLRDETEYGQKYRPYLKDAAVGAGVAGQLTPRTRITRNVNINRQPNSARSGEGRR